jgi:glycosyltransferase involved in cell wall biosynthesis
MLVGLWIVQRLEGAKIIFQNVDDRDFFVSAGILRARDAVLIRGSGVNLSTFLPLPEPEGIPVVTLPARMMWDKGIREFVEAAQQLRQQGVKVRFALAGRVDGASLGAVGEKQLLSWASEGAVEWWGYEQDVRIVFSRSTLICLPSFYREGIPKVLLEAGACGRAVVTTNSPGCREVVREEENGLLVPPRDSSALANAIRRLLEDAPLRARMAKRGREIVEQGFSDRLVIHQTFALYREVLNGRWPSLNWAPPEKNSEVLTDV